MVKKVKGIVSVNYASQSEANQVIKFPRRIISSRRFMKNPSPSDT